MLTLLKLINKYFWRGYVGPFFSFGIPLILLVFIGRILGPSLLIPGIYAVPVLAVLIIFLPQSIFEFKNSSLLKRIGTTHISPYKFLLAISLYNLFIVLISWIILFSFSFAVFFDSLKNEATINPLTNTATPTFMYMITHGDWFGFFYSFFVLIVLSTTVGLWISSIGRSTLFIQSVGMAILLITFFIAPAVYSIAMVANVDIIKYSGYILPLKYPISTMIESLTSGLNNSIVNLNNSTIWDIQTNYGVVDILNNLEKTTAFTSGEKIANLVVPYFFTGFFLYLTAAKFSWWNRSKSNFEWKVYNKFFDAIRTRVKSNSINDNINKSAKQNSKYILEVKNVSKTFNKSKKNEFHALKDISFNVERGRNLALLGANGAGKSVLSEIIVGLNRQDQGEIKYNFAFEKSFKNKIGIQFQDSSYPIGIKCKDVIEFFNDVFNLKMSKEELNSLIDEFGVSEFYTKNASSLSGGQQQRLNLLLAILHKPSLLILDELSTGLDINIRNNIKTFLKEFSEKNNITIIIVSHDISEIKYLCEDVVMIKKGSVVDKNSISNIEKNFTNLEEYVSKQI